MLLRQQIQENMKSALKAGEKEKLSAIRMLWSEVRNKEIDAHKDLDDGEIGIVVNSLVKQRKDSIEQYKAGNRQDLVDKETAELTILLSYMPQQLSAQDIEKLVVESIAESEAHGPADMGKVMKVLMPKVNGKADGKMVSQLAKEKLSA